MEYNSGESNEEAVVIIVEGEYELTVKLKTPCSFF
jgi:hypothetical protein